MPRPKKPGSDGRDVKKRSRNGCWPCKARKVKCGEEKPACATCERTGETCDYSIRLNWDGRNKKKESAPGTHIITFGSQPSPPKSSSSSPVATSENRNIAAAAPGTVAIAMDFSSQPLASAHQHVAPSSMGYHHSPSQETVLPPIAQFTNSVTSPTMVHTTRPLLQASPVLHNPTWSEPPPPAIPQSYSNMTPGQPPRALPPAGTYPSPAEPYHSPAMGAGFHFVVPASQMLPPLTFSAQAGLPESAPSSQTSHKRVRLSPRSENVARDVLPMPKSLSVDEVPRLQPSTHVTFPAVFSHPIIPATVSTPSWNSAEQADDRRISVSSLLSEPNSEERRTSSTTATSMPSHRGSRGSLYLSSISYNDTDTYGHDGGNPDYDLPRNKDILAISGTSPSDACEFDAWLSSTDLGTPEFGFGLASKSTIFAKGGYYASPVPIKIPRKLEPLPATLLENPMNLLYFHHFLNHTACVLVPHDCSENPFKTILPKMAIENPNLLNLLLAYSACHRARLLEHPMPRNRIATWAQDVFSDLRQSLQHDKSNEKVSNANLATAIMLTSLEIISPSSFDINVPWQAHLSLARTIIRSRCGPHSVSPRDTVMYFLTRWMAYLDVIGSLSGRKNDEPLFAGNYWSTSASAKGSSTELSLTDDDMDEDDEFTIDCLLGFTTRCVSILARIALLAHKCAETRTDGKTGEIDEAWRPSSEILKKADNLKRDLNNAKSHEPRNCGHHSPRLGRTDHSRRPSYTEMSEQDAQESLAANSMFHWAGLVHLLRRVYNLPRSDPQVQEAVQELIKTLGTIREGGSAAACILFPMFTAGVEAIDPLQRAEVLRRIKAAEGYGLFQVKRARAIMEKVWDTGASWETQVSGEFFG